MITSPVARSSSTRSRRRHRDPGGIVIVVNWYTPAADLRGQRVVLPVAPVARGRPVQAAPVHADVAGDRTCEPHRPHDSAVRSVFTSHPFAHVPVRSPQPGAQLTPHTPRRTALPVRPAAQTFSRSARSSPHPRRCPSAPVGDVDRRSRRARAAEQSAGASTHAGKPVGVAETDVSHSRSSARRRPRRWPLSRCGPSRRKSSPVAPRTGPARTRRSRIARAPRQEAAPIGVSSVSPSQSSSTSCTVHRRKGGAGVRVVAVPVAVARPGIGSHDDRLPGTASPQPSPSASTNQSATVADRLGPPVAVVVPPPPAPARRDGPPVPVVAVGRNPPAATPASAYTVVGRRPRKFPPPGHHEVGSPSQSPSRPVAQLAKPGDCAPGRRRRSRCPAAMSAGGAAARHRPHASLPNPSPSRRGTRWSPPALVRLAVPVVVHAARPTGERPAPRRRGGHRDATALAMPRPDRAAVAVRRS